MDLSEEEIKLLTHLRPVPLKLKDFEDDFRDDLMIFGEMICSNNSDTKDVAMTNVFNYICVKMFENLTTEFSTMSTKDQYIVLCDNIYGYLTTYHATAEGRRVYQHFPNRKLPEEFLNFVNKKLKQVGKSKALKSLLGISDADINTIKNGTHPQQNILMKWVAGHNIKLAKESTVLHINTHYNPLWKEPSGNNNYRPLLLMIRKSLWHKVINQLAINFVSCFTSPHVLM